MQCTDCLFWKYKSEKSHICTNPLSSEAFQNTESDHTCKSKQLQDKEEKEVKHK